MKKIIHKIAHYLYFVGRGYYSSSSYITRMFEPFVVLGENAHFHLGSKVINQQNNKEKIKIGKNTHIRGELLIFKDSGEIEIGENCYIGEGTRIWAMEKVFIGNNVLIAHNVNIIDNNSHSLDFEERRKEFYYHFFNETSVEIKVDSNRICILDDAWIGLNSIILKGVTIGEGAVVAAGSVVTKNVAPFTLVAGNPAKNIKELKKNSN